MYLVIITLLLGCGFSGIDNAKFSGNWRTCSKDGLYIELLIMPDTFMYSSTNGLITKYSNYKIIGDTLIYRDSNLYKDSTNVKKAIITFVSESQMTMDFITSEEQWTFYKLKEYISDINDIEKLKSCTRTRAIKYRCIDAMINEEHAKDSINEQIFFQF